MTDIERLEDRLAAVERTVVDGTFDVDGMEDPGELAERVEALESRLQELEERLAEVEGTVQSMGGFVGRIQSVNEGVEQRADTAIAAVDRIETRLDELDRTLEQHDIEAGLAVSDETGGSARTRDADRATSHDDASAADSTTRQRDRGGADVPERRIDDVVSGTDEEAPLLGETTDRESSGGGTTAESSSGRTTAESSGGRTAAESSEGEETSVAGDGGGRSFVASQDDVDDRIATDEDRTGGTEAATEPDEGEPGLIDTIRSKFQ